MDDRKVRVLRVLKDLNQTQLAKIVGTTQPVISLIECGCLEPKGELRKNIAVALGIGEEEFFSEN